MYKNVRPGEVRQRMLDGERVRLIDVREPAEHEIASVEGAELLPLSRFNEWAGQLNEDDELIIMCHHGGRSAQVCQFLATRGFENLSNLTGGIDLWSTEVDPSVPRY